MEHYTLIGIIGGSFSLLQLKKIYVDKSKAPETVEEKKLNTKDFKSLQELLEKFLSEIKDKATYPKLCILSIAAPVDSKATKLLNTSNFPGWENTDATEISKKLNFQKMFFVNDFVALGYGVQTDLQKDKDYVILNDKPKRADGNILVLGPGTGFGVTFGTQSSSDKYHEIYSSEGSHVEAPGRNEKVFQFAQYLKKYKGINFITAEMTCCASAIVPMYKFLYEFEKKNVERLPEIAKLVDAFECEKDCKNEREISGLILENGMNGKCQLSQKTLEMFIEIFGMIVGNVAIQMLPEGGIYLVGNLAIALMPMILKSDIFMKNYLDKENENFKKMVENLPIYFVKDTELGIKGLAERIRRFIEQNP